MSETTTHQETSATSSSSAGSNASTIAGDGASKPRLPPRSSHFSTRPTSKHSRGGGHYQPPHRTGKTPMKDALDRQNEPKTAAEHATGHAEEPSSTSTKPKKAFKPRQRKPKQPKQTVHVDPSEHQQQQHHQSQQPIAHDSRPKAPTFVLASSSDPETVEVKLSGSSSLSSSTEGSTSGAKKEISAEKKNKWKQKRALKRQQQQQQQQQQQHHTGSNQDGEGGEGGSAPKPKVPKADKFKKKNNNKNNQKEQQQPQHAHHRQEHPHNHPHHLPADPSHPAFALAPEAVQLGTSQLSSSAAQAPHTSAAKAAGKKPRGDKKPKIPKKYLDKIASTDGKTEATTSSSSSSSSHDRNSNDTNVNNPRINASVMPARKADLDKKLNDGRRKKERKRFKEYMNEEDVKLELEKGTLVEGGIRINPHNRKLAYVTVDGFERDILIEGIKNRNRAFDGDTVVLRLFPEEEESKSSKAKEGGADNATDASIKETKAIKSRLSQDLLVDHHLGAGERDYSSSDEDVEAEDDFDAETKAAKEEDDTKQGKRRTGEVVFISQANHPSEFVGYLKPAGGDTKGPIAHNDKFAFLVPLDKKLPRFIVAIKDFHIKKLVHSAEEWNTNLFVCKELPWKISNEHPHAKLTQNLGLSGEMEVELQAIIKANSIDQSDFPPQVLTSLPSANWQIPSEEIGRRRDMRNDRIFTIDPLTARDMDDAISCIMINDDIAEVGVHIADVTYFLQEGTKLDEIARKRATTVYFVEFSIPMLPRVLCDTLCSLNPHEDRLSISVVWKMNIKTAEVVEKPWIGRTVIRSCCKLDYGTAQSMIEGTFDAKNHSLALDPTHKEHTIDQIVEDVKVLDGIAKILRKRRFDTGALSLNTVKLCFRFDKEKERGNALRATPPVSCFVYETKDSNHLIEEFALLANAEVARTIHEAYPNHSMIRIHESPRPDFMEEYIQFCEKLGITIDYSSSGALHRSIQAAADPSDPHKLQILQLLATKAFKQAKYICTGVGLASDGGVKKPPTFESFRHYALNEPLYTHFTSPIRRYADVVVHRILLSVLNNSVKPPMEKSIVADIAKNCNDKKTKATRASEDCDFMYLWSILRAKPAKETGVVIDVNSKSFEVLIPNYGEALMAYIEDMPEVVTCEYNSEKKQLVLGLSEDYDTGDGVSIVASSSSSSTTTSSSSSQPEDGTPSTAKETTPSKKVGKIVNVNIFSKFLVEVRGEFNNKKMQVKLRVLF
eukprot:TRINITY_DN984_c0_g1_i4.p1 TRINITY_DN984_c0_g1~~TRINITY_DN984_c0_g1_i4.p1  ORF type:complete len:1231 (+),score=388.91 TRINITY_DN984_c0_g1_i4:364-4056(+)